MSAEMEEAGKLHPYLSLDSWRGLACTIVVSHHAWAALSHKYPSIAQSVLSVVFKHGYLGVQIFFVISGFCIAHAALSTKLTGRPVRSYVVARFHRIFPTYWLSLPIFIVLNAAGAYAIQHKLVPQGDTAYIDIFHSSPLMWLSNLSLTPKIFGQLYLNGVAWTLSYEVAFYVIVAVLLLLARKPSTMFSLAHVLTTACLLFLVAVPREQVFPLNLWPQFGLGFLVYDLLRNPNKSSVKMWGLAITVLTLGVIGRLALLDGSTAFGFKAPALSDTAALIFAVTILVIHRFDNVLSKTKGMIFLAWLGIFSYSTYLTHFFTIIVLSMAAKTLHFPDNAVMTHLLLLLEVVIPIGLARVFFQFCERPFMHRGTRPTVSAVHEPVSS